jgi:hypothetical protein
VPQIAGPLKVELHQLVALVSHHPKASICRGVVHSDCVPAVNNSEWASNAFPNDTSPFAEPRHSHPHDSGYDTYVGSLTAPPCSESVDWFVLKTPGQISAEEINAFAQLYPHNVRPP